MFCPKCGAQNPDGARFCGGCGGDLQPAAAPAATTPTPAPVGATPASVPSGIAPTTTSSGPMAMVQALLAQKPVRIGLIAVVAIIVIAVIVSLVLGPSKVSYTMSQNGYSIGPVGFAKEGNELVVTTVDGNASSTVRLTKEGTMDGGTIYSLAAGDSSSIPFASSSYSTKYLIPDGFFRGDLKGKWIVYTQYGSSSGSAVGVDIKNDGTGTAYSISSMNEFPTSFSVMESAKNTENLTWNEKGGKWTFSIDGSTVIVEKK